MNENSVKIKTFRFPAFEEWEKRENNVRVELGAYCCEVRAFSWRNKVTTYMLAASYRDTNPLNIYTAKLFSRLFDDEGDKEKLKNWYETSIKECNEFFVQLIKADYIEA